MGDKKPNKTQKSKQSDKPVVKPVTPAAKAPVTPPAKAPEKTPAKAPEKAPFKKK